MTSPKLSRIIGLLCLSTALAAQVAFAEIPAGEEVPTSRAYKAAEKQFMLRTIVDPYVARQKQQGVAVDEDVQTFLQDWAELAQHGLGNRDNTALFVKGQQLDEAGCDDAMFHYAFGRLLRYRGDHEQAVKHLQKAVDQLAPQGYDISYQCWASNHLSQSLAHIQRFAEAEAVCAGEFDMLVQTVASPTYRPDEQRILYDHVKWYFDNWPIEKHQQIVEKMAATAGVSEWMQHFVQGKLESRLAWQARGSGWASEVTEEGWKKFGEHMEQAHKHLKAAWDLDSTAPEPAAELISLAMSGNTPSGETPRYWFDFAVSAQLDYEPAYHNLRWSLMPRWGGSHEQMLALGRECLKTGRFDTYVPYRYYEIVSEISSDIGSSFEIYKDKVVLDELVEMADGYLGQPATEWNHGWMKSLKVAAAVRAERWEDARRFLLELDVEPVSDAFARFALKPDDAIGEIHARTGDFAAPVKEAEELLAAQDLDGTATKYQELLEKSGDREKLSRYFRRQLAWVEMQKKLAAGEWVSVLPDASLTDWRTRKGIWSLDESGRLVGKASTDGLLLTYERKLGTRLEIRGEATFVESPQGNANIGIYFGQESGLMRNSFRFSLTDGVAGIMEHDEAKEKLEITVADTNRFLVQRWDDTLTAYLNDQLIAKDVPIEAFGLPANEVIGVGGYYWFNGPVIQFEQLEVRRLESRPGEVATAGEAESD